MVRPQVAGGGNGLQVRAVDANVSPHKQSRRADKGCSSSLGTGRGVRTGHRNKSTCYGMFQKVFRLWMEPVKFEHQTSDPSVCVSICLHSHKISHWYKKCIVDLSSQCGPGRRIFATRCQYAQVIQLQVSLRHAQKTFVVNINLYRVS